VSDKYGNTLISEITLTVQSGLPTVTGIDKLAQTINPMTGVPMDLLSGVKALDAKNQDITQNTKVYIKNTDGTYTQIENPRIYTTNTAGTLQLKYEVSDAYGNSIVTETSLIVKQGTATITGLDQLPQLLNPTTGLAMNLLT
jgi:hypothetical protein